ncbi:MAG: HEAT repeat domain-containing protein [Planctomycetes bacterium]|nr:HEAT repeat domain-containing protein [Planctomycetota bacterium]
MNSHRLLVAYGVLVTAAAIACAAGWWLTRVEFDQLVTERHAPLSPGGRWGPGVREETPSPAGRDVSPLTLPFPAAGERGKTGTTTDSLASEPTNRTDAPARCPHCGKSLDSSVTGVPPVPADKAPAGKGTRKDPSPPPLQDWPWPPQSLADVPGGTLRDKVATFIERLRAEVEGLPPGDLKGRYRLREMLSGVLKEAKNDPALPRVLLDLFTGESEEIVAEALGWHLQVMKLPTEERAEFDRLLDTLTSSTDPLQRRKGFRHLSASNDDEDRDRWAQALRSDYDPTVRAVAAEHPLRRFPDGGDMLVQAAQYDSDLTVRLAAIRSLGETASPTEMGVLVRLLRTDPSVAVQEAAIRAFSYGATPRDTEVRTALLDVARDPSRAASVRMQALQDLLWGHSGSFVEDRAERSELEAMMTRIKQAGTSGTEGK